MIKQFAKTHHEIITNPSGPWMKRFMWYIVLAVSATMVQNDHTNKSIIHCIAFIMFWMFTVQPLEHINCIRSHSNECKTRVCYFSPQSQFSTCIIYTNVYNCPLNESKSLFRFRTLKLIKITPICSCYCHYYFQSACWFYWCSVKFIGHQLQRLYIFSLTDFVMWIE